VTFSANLEILLCCISLLKLLPYSLKNNMTGKIMEELNSVQFEQCLSKNLNSFKKRKFLGVELDSIGAKFLDLS
jgi:hypothetical protein